jgi:hypothetical protein
MSSGHHTHHHHNDRVLRELKRLLAEPDVKKWLDKPYKVDFSHPMPLTGGSTVDWGTFFLDPVLKERFKVGRRRNVDLAPFVLRHEIVEKALRLAKGMSYDRAHAYATCAEHQDVTAAGLDWDAYKSVMRKITSQNEHERPKGMPKGYDYGPLRASRDVKALRGVRRVA